MKNVLQIELNKAIKTRYFAISIIIGTIIGIVGLVYNVNLVYNSQIYDGINPCYEGFTLFNHWIGGEGFSLGHHYTFLCFRCLSHCRMAGHFAEKKIADICVRCW